MHSMHCNNNDNTNSNNNNNNNNNNYNNSNSFVCLFYKLILLFFLVLFAYSRKECRSIHVQFIFLLKGKMAVKFETFNLGL